jgi:hypothetical protein
MASSIHGDKGLSNSDEPYSLTDPDLPSDRTGGSVTHLESFGCTTLNQHQISIKIKNFD